MIKNNIDSFVEIPQKQPTAMASKQATICLDSSSHASKAAKPVPLTATIPKKPFKSKTTTSGQMDYGKTPQKEKAIFLCFCVLSKRIRLRVRSNFSAHTSEELPLFLPLMPYIEVRSDPLK